MKVIQLTNKATGDTMYINAERIVFWGETSEDDKYADLLEPRPPYTYVEMTGGEQIMVVESAKTIVQMVTA